MPNLPPTVWPSHPYSFHMRILVALLLLPTVAAAQQAQLVREVVVAGTEGSRIEVSRSGALAFAEPAGKQVRVITADGRRIVLLDQAASAEESFQRISALGWIGATDSLWVVDQALQKVFVFSPTLQYVRSFQQPSGLRGTLPWVTSRQVPAIHAVLGGDRLVLEGYLALPPTLRPGHRAYPVLTKEDGEVLAMPVNLAVTDTTGCGQSVTWQGRSFSFNGLFCTVPIPDVSRVDGSMVTTPGLAVAGVVTRVVRVSPSGDTLYHRQVVVSSRDRLSAAEIDSAATALAADPQPSSPPELNRLVDSVRRANAPEFRLAFQRILVGLDGTIWLQRATSGPEEWLVVGETQQLLVVQLPDRARLKAATRETVWLIERGTTAGEANLVRYRVTEGR